MDRCLTEIYQKMTMVTTVIIMITVVIADRK